jgi:translation initiation factor IF-3
VNRKIRVPRVLVIDDEGNRLGEFLTLDAIVLAEERGLDLIEVAPNGRPPVCKIGDYGKLKYDRKKREAAARKNQVQVQIKEVKVRPKTHGHDFEVKVQHSRRFLEHGDKVKVTVRFRGRELAHRDIGVERCREIAKRCEDLGEVELHPRMDGRQMIMIIAPFKKKTRRQQQEGDSRGSSKSAPAPEAAASEVAASEAAASEAAASEAAAPEAAAPEAAAPEAAAPEAAASEAEAAEAPEEEVAEAAAPEAEAEAVDAEAPASETPSDEAS